MEDRWEKFLRECGFVPWRDGGMIGFHRHIDFVKDCLAGEIGRYSADDYIIVSHDGSISEEWLKENWQPKEDVMQHRFLLADSDRSGMTIKSYWFGLRGWLQILHYRKGDREKRFEDLIYLVEQRDSV